MTCSICLATGHQRLSYSTDTTLVLRFRSTDGDSDNRLVEGKKSVGAATCAFSLASFPVTATPEGLKQLPSCHELHDIPVSATALLTMCIAGR
jgi:hypothetical protein